MSTFANLKDWFARAIGESDGSSIDQTGEDLINDSFKELCSRYPFLSNKKSTTVVLTAGVGSLPSDIDLSHISEKNLTVYTYDGPDKTTYDRVELDDISSFGTDDYKYALDLENSQIKSNQSTTLNFDYFSVPADLVNDSDVVKFSIPKAISFQAAGDFWQDFEEEPDQAQLKYARAELLFNRAIAQDQKNRVNKRVNHFLKRFNLGFN